MAKKQSQQNHKPQPSPSLLAKYKKLGWNYHWEWWKRGKHHAFARWVLQVADQLPHLGFNSSVLIYGSGTGVLARVLKDRGYQVTGIEAIDSARDIATLRVHGAAFVESLSASDTWDYVICFDVIQHLDDAAELIEAVNERCTNYAVITCPHDDAYAPRQYTDLDIINLFKPSPVQLQYDDGGARRIFEIIPHINTPAIHQVEYDEEPEPEYVDVENDDENSGDFIPSDSDDIPFGEWSSE
jgi:SAM-dependent methyltransferase